MDNTSLVVDTFLKLPPELQAKVLNLYISYALCVSVQDTSANLKTLRQQFGAIMDAEMTRLYEKADRLNTIFNSDSFEFHANLDDVLQSLSIGTYVGDLEDLPLHVGDYVWDMASGLQVLIANKNQGLVFNELNRVCYIAWQHNGCWTRKSPDQWNLVDDIT